MKKERIGPFYSDDETIDILMTAGLHEVASYSTWVAHVT